MLSVVLFACVLIGLIQQGVAATCACATSNLNVRSGPGTNYGKIGLLTASTCVPYLNEQRTGGAYRWAKITFNGRTGWAATNWIRFQTCPTSGGGCPRIITRSQWGARYASLSSISTPSNIFVHHTAGGSCYTQSSCSAVVRSVQNYHMDSRGYRDIAYSFLIGEDGNVYEGRGWGKQGAHTKNYNSNSLGFCVIGTFTSRLPNQAALTALRKLIDCAKSGGKVISNYRLRGHRDVGSTACPGTTLYNHIRGWPHYS